MPLIGGAGSSLAVDLPLPTKTRPMGIIERVVSLGSWWTPNGRPRGSVLTAVAVDDHLGSLSRSLITVVVLSRSRSRLSEPTPETPIPTPTSSALAGTAAHMFAAATMANTYYRGFHSLLSLACDLPWLRVMGAVKNCSDG
jgi:hypothetical protein